MLISIREARERLGVSRDTMRKLIQERTFTVYSSPTDRRKKLLDQAELDAYKEPVVLQERKEARA